MVLSSWMYERAQKAFLYSSLCASTVTGICSTGLHLQHSYTSQGGFCQALHPVGANKEIVTFSSAADWMMTVKDMLGQGEFKASVTLAQCMRAILKLSATYYSNS